MLLCRATRFASIFLVAALAPGGCRAVLGIDTNESGGVTAADAALDRALCVPICARRSCGTEPACGTSCGRCVAPFACFHDDRYLLSDTSAASCGPPTMVWEVDGVELVREASYHVDSDAADHHLTFGAKRLELSVFRDSAVGLLRSCETSPVMLGPMRLRTIDAPASELPVLPEKWRDLTIEGCGTTSAGDFVRKGEVTLSVVTATRLAGTWEIAVVGGGTRAGSTLRAHGAFDLEVAPR